MNFDFYMPVRVVSGRTALADSAAQLKKLGDSCMVVTGKRSAKASGALDDLTEVLRREKISYTVYDGITENPCSLPARKRRLWRRRKRPRLWWESEEALLWTRRRP